MSNQENVTYEVTVQEDPETGDLLMPIPEEVLQRFGWKEGDELEWNQTSDGSWVLSKYQK